MNLYLARHGPGFLPADEGAEKLHRRLQNGECVLVKPLRVRDLNAHKRYWQLMTMCADNCERIEIGRGVFLDVHSKDDVHTAIKFCTGYYNSIFDEQGREVFRIPKSTSFEDMTADEWERYWPRVLDVVQEKVMPGVNLDSVRYEIERCMGKAA